MMVWVWPPQISINTQGRVVVWTISAAKARAMRWSRYSSRYFMALTRRGGLDGPGGEWRRELRFRFQRSHLFEKLVCALGFDCVHTAYGEAHMDHHIVALVSLGNKVQRYLAHDPAELHAGHTHLT